MGEQANTGRTFGQDVLFVLDCSRSMLASDVTPAVSSGQAGDYGFCPAPRARTRRTGRFLGAGFPAMSADVRLWGLSRGLAIIDDKTIPVPAPILAARWMKRSTHSKRASNRNSWSWSRTRGSRKRRRQNVRRLAKQHVVVFTIGVGTAAGAEIKSS